MISRQMRSELVEDRLPTSSGRNRLAEPLTSDAANIQPELLATTVFSHKAADPGEAVGSIYALHAIADGATLTHALDKLDVDDPDITAAVRASYESMIGDDERTVSRASSNDRMLEINFTAFI